MDHRERTARFAKISTALARQSDQQLTEWVDAAEQLASGIGGTTLAMAVDGYPVFAKRVRLTDLERQPENHRSTANLFGLPTPYQRNVGSAGFGVWRELAAHAMTTDWVRSQQLETFPLMLHWRVLEGAAAPSAAPLPDELADIGRMVGYWGGADAVRVRLQALADAKASVVIFLEHLPWTLSAWLQQQLAAGPAAMTSACALVERSLTVDVPRMNALGLLHGDAHFENILTDGHRLYFADLGLATSERFALSADELAYLHHHASLDRAYVLARWVNWLVKAFAPAASSVPERMALIRAAAQGQALHALIPELPAHVAAIIQRHAPVAARVNDFYVQLHGESRSAPYPRDAIEALLSAVPISQ